MPTGSRARPASEAARPRTRCASSPSSCARSESAWPPGASTSRSSTTRASAACEATGNPTARVKFVGDRLRRKEDPRLLEGRGRYVGDIVLPGMLHAVILRSPHAHARIGAIDVEQARAVTGLHAIFTFADLGAAARPLPVIPPHPALRAKNFHPLASDRTRFVGEAVAVVVAESQRAAEDARERIRVEYAPLASAQDPASPVGALVHDDISDNLAGRVTLARGNVETALCES